MAKGKKKSTETTARDAASTADGTRRPGVAAARRELDRLDGEILAAMNRRAELALKIGELKREAGQDVFDAEREASVIDRAAEANRGPLSSDSVRAVFRELISGSRAVQSTTRVAYLGPEFTFSHLAAIERFGQSAELVPVGTIAAVFEEVERGHAEFGVVPMENSTDGRVSDTLDCFSRSKARICGELPLRIHHCLLGSGTRDGVPNGVQQTAGPYRNAATGSRSTCRRLSCGKSRARPMLPSGRRKIRKPRRWQAHRQA